MTIARIQDSMNIDIFGNEDNDDNHKTILILLVETFTNMRQCSCKVSVVSVRF